MKITREDACRVWLAAGELSAESIRLLLDHFGSAEGAYDALDAHGICAFDGLLLPKTAAYLSEEASPRKLHDKLTAMEKHSIRLLTEDDASWPEILRQIPDPPAQLFYQGELSCLIGRHLAMIGTRKCSDYGREHTTQIAAELSQNGVIVVSGMADGIDTAALDGAMSGGTPVIAVLGGGLDRYAPCGREGIGEDILQKGGLILSEYAPQTIVQKYHFPQRNRLISALSDAVLFMEGRIKSGGMLTVGAALDQGKDVYAFPGAVGLAGSEGPLQVIREGATLFRDASDILLDMGWEERAVAPPKVLEDFSALPPDQQRILKLLTLEEQSFEQLSAKTGLDPASLNVALTMLDLQGLIRQGAGRIYHKC